MWISYEQPVTNEEHEDAVKAIDMTDRIVYGGSLHKYVHTIIINRDSFGDENKNELLKGISDIWDGSKTIHLHLGHDSGNGKTNAWGIAHDLAHLFDIIHGNLKFNLEKGTLIYLGKEYELNEGANTTIPESRRLVIGPHGRYVNYRNNVFYTGMCHYEPWETKALFLADNVWCQLNREEGPNFIRKVSNE